jgi:hypothetical protein
MKYKLQPYAGMQSRYRCPGCNHHSKSFVRYIDTQTGQQLPPHIGRCGRVDKCGYHVKPEGQFAVGSGQFAGSSKKSFGQLRTGNCKPANCQLLTGNCKLANCQLLTGNRKLANC